jgi:hypothetical protein
VQSEHNTKLYRSYVLSDAASGVLRHRGNSPRQAAFFRNPEVNFQAARLASLLVLHGLLGGTAVGIEPRYRVGSLESGALFCRAYEAYTDLHPPAAISFAHAWWAQWERSCVFTTFDRQVSASDSFRSDFR